jgi:probable HAF family extracellular repeat protein
MGNRMRTRAVVITTMIAASAAVAQTPSFTLIDPAPGYTSSRIYAISADGNAAAGASSPITLQPGFYWIRSSGRTDFGLQSGLPANTPAVVISGTGEYVGGNGFPGSPSHIFRWSAAGGYQNLGGIAGWASVNTTGMNGDGSTMVGYVQNGGGTSPPTDAPFRWTSGGGFQNLGYLRPSSSYAQALGVSRDGNVVVGFSAFSSTGGPAEAFRWTPTGGMQALAPEVNPPFTETVASAVSGNGAVIVGYGSGPAHPWRWSEGTGMVDLGLAPGALDGVVKGSNYDGTVLLASMFLPSELEVPYLWLAESGYVRFTNYLTSNGVTLPTGYTSYTVTSVSDDGRTFGGWVSGSGITRAFVATVPAPGMALGLIASFSLTTKRTRRRVAGADSAARSSSRGA